MGYLFIAIAVLSQQVKGYCGKKLGKINCGLRDNAIANLIRMVLCIGISLVIALINRQDLTATPKLLWITLLSGISMATALIAWLTVIKVGAYMLLSVFVMLGVFIPVVLSWLIYGEPILLKHIIGLILLITAAILMCSYNNSIKKKLTTTAILLLLLCTLSNGLGSFSQKMFVNSFPDYSVNIYNLYTYLFCSAALLISMLFGSKEKGTPTATLIRKTFLYLLAMSVTLYLSNFAIASAAGHLTSAQLYPLNQGANLILSTLMSSVAFKEPPTRKSMFGLILAFCALIIINAA